MALPLTKNSGIISNAKGKKQILRLLSTIGDIRNYLKLVFMNLAGGFKYILLHESE